MKLIGTLIILGILLVGCTAVDNEITVNNTDANNNVDNNMDDGASGDVYVAITDAAADMGAVSSVMVRIDDVELRNEANAWTTVSSNAQTYDLLALKAQQKEKLFAHANLEYGTYDRLRLEVIQVAVVDAQGEHEATLPAQDIEFDTRIVVNERGDAIIVLDFIADESLHTTQEGEYIFAPVVQANAYSEASINIASDNAVVVTGGQATHSTKVGMDIDGNVGVGLTIPADIVLTVDGVLGSSIVETNTTSNVNVGIY